MQILTKKLQIKSYLNRLQLYRSKHILLFTCFPHPVGEDKCKGTECLGGNHDGDLLITEGDCNFYSSVDMWLVPHQRKTLGSLLIVFLKSLYYTVKWIFLHKIIHYDCPVLRLSFLKIIIFTLSY